jgi:hypothetical protein
MPTKTGVSLSRFRFAIPHDVYGETFEGDELRLNAGEREHREHKEHGEPRRVGLVHRVRLAMKGEYPEHVEV